VFVLDYAAPESVQEVRFELVDFLREIISFSTPEELVEQIAKDVERTREVLADQELYGFIDGLPQPISYFEDGRIDFTHSPRTAALGVFVVWKGEVLLLKRSNEVGSYPGAWHIATGYLDERGPIREKAEIELWEEAGIPADLIGSFTVIPVPTLAQDPQGRDLLLFNCLAVLHSKPTITLNWEHTDWTWIEPIDLCEHAEVPGIERALEEILPYIPKP
jgi:8-oxo-dGTP pyrophosphatase MutT (NUDIX family)